MPILFIMKNFTIKKKIKMSEFFEIVNIKKDKLEGVIYIFKQEEFKENNNFEINYI